MSKELKPCPFCGGKVAVATDSIDIPFDVEICYKVVCLKCMASMGWCNSRDKAVMLWNRRKYKYSHSLFKKLRRRRNHG